MKISGYEFIDAKFNPIYAVVLNKEKQVLGVFDNYIVAKFFSDNYPLETSIYSIDDIEVGDC